MATLKVAGVGAGYFSRFHYDSWRDMIDVEVVGVCDLDPVKAAATGFPIMRNLSDMLAETVPDILDIILPSDAHADAIQQALNAGVKTIICQKPFCRELQEAEAMTQAADAAGAVLVVHENFRFQPWYRSLKGLLARRVLGDVHQMTFRLRPGDGQGPRAYLDRQPYFQRMERFLIHETAVHWVDTFRYLFGSPNAVYADLRQMNDVIAGEDAGLVLFDHDGGVRTLFDGNRSLDHAAHNHRCTMGEALVEGTEGTILLQGDGSLWLRRFGEVDAACVLEAQDWAGFGGDCVDALQRHVVQGVQQGQGFENTAKDYLEVIRIEEMIYRSAQRGTKVALV